MSIHPVRLFLKKGEEEQIRLGFPWIFENEIAFIKITDSDGKITQLPYIECNVPDGSIAEAYSKGGLFLGCGILNKKSKIPLRILSRSHAENGLETFDVQFFVNRIQSALDARSLFFTPPDSYRLVFTEADLLPGLTVDRFCDIDGRIFLSVQFLTLGVEIFRPQIIEALKAVCNPLGIFERSDVSVRELEGLSEQKGWIGKAFESRIVIRENGLKLRIDLENGQKTGYFLDQKHNRALVSRLAKGRRVLDTFSHTGAFGLNASAGGAKEVVSTDISAEAVALIEENTRLNGFERVMSAVCADTFDLLRDYEKRKETFDLIVLDPPAFTKSAKMIEKAYGGYKEINIRAMKLLSPGGLLITCSCSHFFDSTIFYDMIAHAARDAKKTVQILEKRGPSSDHPILIGYPKSDYLTCAVLRVL